MLWVGEGSLNLPVSKYNFKVHHIVASKALLCGIERVAAAHQKARHTNAASTAAYYGDTVWFKCSIHFSPATPGPNRSNHCVRIESGRVHQTKIYGNTAVNVVRPRPCRMATATHGEVGLLASRISDEDPQGV